MDQRAAALVQEGMALLEKVAGQLYRRYSDLFEFDELRSVGYEGLLRAAQSFEPSHAVPFTSYAWRRVHGFVMNEVGKRVEFAKAQRMHVSGGRAVMLLDDAGSISNNEKANRLVLSDYCQTVAAAMAISGTTRDMATSGTTTEEDMDLAATKARLQKAIANLDPVMAKIITAHYVDCVTLTTLAEELNMSYRTIRRRHNEALRELLKQIRPPKVPNPPDDDED